MVHGACVCMVHGSVWCMRVDVACDAWCMCVEAGQYMDSILMVVVRHGDGRWVVVRVLRKGFKMGSQQGWVAEGQIASASMGG